MLHGPVPWSFATATSTRPPLLRSLGHEAVAAMRGQKVELSKQLQSFILCQHKEFAMPSLAVKRRLEEVSVELPKMAMFIRLFLVHVNIEKKSYLCARLPNICQTVLCTRSFLSLSIHYTSQAAATAKEKKKKVYDDLETEVVQFHSSHQNSEWKHDFKHVAISKANSKLRNSPQSLLISLFLSLSSPCSIKKKKTGVKSIWSGFKKCRTDVFFFLRKKIFLWGRLCLCRMWRVAHCKYTDT